MRELQGHGSSVRSLSWAAQGDKIASASGCIFGSERKDNSVRIWDLDGVVVQPPEALQQKPLGSMYWRPDGTRLAVTFTYEPRVSKDLVVKGKKIHIWEMSTSQIVFVLSGLLARTCHNLTRTSHNLTRICHNLTRNFLSGHLAAVTCVVWDEANGRLVSTAMDDTLRVWSDVNGQQLFCITEERLLGISPKGNHFLKKTSFFPLAIQTCYKSNTTCYNLTRT